MSHDPIEDPIEGPTNDPVDNLLENAFARALGEARSPQMIEQIMARVQRRARYRSLTLLAACAFGALALTLLVLPDIAALGALIERAGIIRADGADLTAPTALLLALVAASPWLLATLDDRV